MKTLRSKAYPADRLLNPVFRYVPALLSDIRATFARIRQEQTEVRVVHLNQRKK